MRNLPYRKWIVSLWLICMMMVSVVLVAPRFSSANWPFRERLTASIDAKIGNTLELTASSSAASLAVSALPGDTATPLAEKLADFGGGFLVVLCALYFEKCMFAVIGYLLFAVFIPVALLLLMLSQFWQKRLCRTLAACLSISGILLFLMIPTGLAVSDMVYVTQKGVIQETIDASGNLSLEIEEGLQESEGQDDKEAGLLEKAKGMLTTVSTFSADMVQKAKDLMTGFLHSLALMVVTACVVPIAVILLFLWMVKLVFQLGFFIGAPDFPGWRRGRKAECERGDSL